MSLTRLLVGVYAPNFLDGPLAGSVGGKQRLGLVTGGV